MSHEELALEVAILAGLNPSQVSEPQLEAVRDAMASAVAIESSTIAAASDEDRNGLGFLNFRKHTFYSVKLGNASRDLLGTAGFGGSALASITSISALITAGSLGQWAGLSALAAISLALIGRAKPFLATFGLDEATALDLVWRHSQLKNGFRLVEFAELRAAIGEAERLYGNAGFSAPKLSNALNKLLALGMIADAGPGRYQLIESFRVAGEDKLRLAYG
jgi:hypothetical protein